MNQDGGLNISPVETTHSARGVPSFACRVTHEGLAKHRLFRGHDLSYVLEKARLQAVEWDMQWRQKISNFSAREWLVGKKDEARNRTEAAQGKVGAIETILAGAKVPDLEEAWRALLGDTVYRAPEPVDAPIPEMPNMPQHPEEPDATRPPYAVVVTFKDYLLPGRPRKLRERAAQMLEEAMAAWRQDSEDWRIECESRKEAYRRDVEDLKRTNVAAKDEWLAAKRAFQTQLESRRAEVTALRSYYENHEAEAVATYVDAVLAMSAYPEGFPQKWNLDYIAEAKTLVIDYQMPGPAAMPKVKEVKFVASRNELTESYLSESARGKLYDSALYQTALRAAWEVFRSDTAEACDALCLNGLVKAINPGTGLEVESCVLSLQVRKGEFLQVNLQAVDPKECFKRFKGIASGKLSGLVAVAPIQKIDRRDARFVDGHAVLGGVDEGVNLAAMDWQDFEHLIRELFEREFNADGSEVRITQASRDGGVDAVVFDSDPIRGGKIVIQAKRYTGLVDVSAVRDLYGTVHNEGAIKGILVTTSNYGPDAYEFAKGKPLTLLNGGNLMHLLQKHGTRAHIDLKSAKAFFKAQERAPTSRS